MREKREIAIFFLVGAIFGSLGDFFHVVSGTEIYPSKSLLLPIFGVPAWVAPEMGLATVCLWLSHRFLGRRSSPQGTIWIVGGFVWLLLLWALSAFLPLQTGGGKDLVLWLGALVAWFGLQRTIRGALMAGLVAIAGCSVEALLVHWGIFSYSPMVANLFGVPSWLPALYAVASFAMGNALKGNLSAT